MAKPGQRPSEPPIIDISELKTPLRYFIEISITVFLWILWFYWIVPIALVILLILKFKIRYGIFYANLNYEHLMNMIFTSLSGVIFVLVMELFWIFYNFLKLSERKGERRKSIPACAQERLDALFKIPSDLLEKAKKQTRLEVIFQEGEIEIKF